MMVLVPWTSPLKSGLDERESSINFVLHIMRSNSVNRCEKVNRLDGFGRGYCEDRLTHPRAKSCHQTSGSTNIPLKSCNFNVIKLHTQHMLTFWSCSRPLKYS